MGVTRDKFLLRHVVFQPSETKGRMFMNYKGNCIGWIDQIAGESGWSYGFAAKEKIGEAESRHNASEALLDAWIAEHGE
jgi:hypothetical protein